jgi:hypothetical protein
VQSEIEEYQPEYQASVAQFRFEFASTAHPTTRAFFDQLSVAGGTAMKTQIAYELLLGNRSGYLDNAPVFFDPCAILVRKPLPVS